jgi:phosphonate transport system substrate-binding protein
MLPLYRFITRYVGERLGCPTKLVVGSSYEQLVREVDLAFVCGLPYVELTRGRDPVVEPIAAPVLQGDRYGGRPIYFSDVIVHRDSPFQSFQDLRGRSWCYNEPHSQSGYGIIRYHLLQIGETNGYFSKVIRTGFHERSLHLVCTGEVDASAIDSQVLAIARRTRPELVSQLRVIDTLGPSSIQPIVAARRLPDRWKTDLRNVLLAMHQDPVAKKWLAHGFVDRFLAVTDADYDDIRHMLAAAEAADFLTIH